MTKKFLLSLPLLLFIIGSSTAEQIEIRYVSELIKPADLIARISIISIQETGAKEGYTKIAQARVTDSIKGLGVDNVFELENDVANVKCPNVGYAEGEDVLLFAKKMSNGRYETLYADAGKFIIEGEAISRRPFKEGQSYISARAKIRQEMRRIGGIDPKVSDRGHG